MIKVRPEKAFVAERIDATFDRNDQHHDDRDEKRDEIRTEF
jgi:hypothetical protein